MGGFEVVLLVIVLVVVAAAVAIAWVRRFQPRWPGRAREPWPSGPDTPSDDTTATVHLEVTSTDADDPAVRRLVRRASERAFRSSPELREVTVVNRNGAVLTTVPRPRPIEGPLPTVTAGPAPHGKGLDLRVPQPGEAAAGGQFEPSPTRSWADRFDLPEVVRHHLRDPDSLVGVVCAIVEAAGLPVDVHGDVVRSGDVAIVVTGEDWGGSATDELSAAFLRFDRTGASHGLVVSAHYLDEREVRRRRALAPNLHYSGLHIVQWMADAVAAGGDPLRVAISLDAPGT
jgi:hypothetical protein